MIQNFPRIMLVDMNSFFASVEQQANPHWRGKALGVCASLHDSSCLIAASKEAKVLGIKTGTLVYQAKKICPKIILVQAEPEKYREVNRQINRIFLDYTDKVESYSIDESFLDLREDFCNAEFISASKKRDPEMNSGLRKKRRNLLNALVIAAEIKRRIRHEVGEWLTCSIGVAPNKFMAKLAADMQKPDGLSLVWRENLPEIYKNKKLRDLWGIARGWEARLAKLGITRPGQLLGYPVQNLISLFGKPGYYIWQRVNGLEEDEISDPNQGLDHSWHSDVIRRLVSPQKSFGHSWVLNFRTTDKERLKPVILRLAEKASRRMRQEGMTAYGFYISVRMADGGYLGKTKKLKHSINTGLELYEQALVLWKDWEFKSEVMHIAVGFNQLVEYSEQLTIPDLIRDPLHKLKPIGDYCSGSPLSRGWDKVRGCGEDLTVILDKINDKYGEFTIRSGLLTRTSDFAPDAIAFGR